MIVDIWNERAGKYEPYVTFYPRLKKFRDKYPAEQGWRLLTQPVDLNGLNAHRMAVSRELAGRAVSRAADTGETQEATGMLVGFEAMLLDKDGHKVLNAYAFHTVESTGNWEIEMIETAACQRLIAKDGCDSEAFLADEIRAMEKHGKQVKVAEDGRLSVSDTPQAPAPAAPLKGAARTSKTKDTAKTAAAPTATPAASAMLKQIEHLRKVKGVAIDSPLPQDEIAAREELNALLAA